MGRAAGMLVITPKQYEALQAYALAAFEPIALEHLRTELADLTEDLPDAVLLERIRVCGRRAMDLGLETHEEMLGFIDAGLLLDEPDFDRAEGYGWAQAILANPDLSPATKAERLLDIAFEIHQTT